MPRQRQQEVLQELLLAPQVDGREVLGLDLELLRLLGQLACHLFWLLELFLCFCFDHVLPALLEPLEALTALVFFASLSRRHSSKSLCKEGSLPPDRLSFPRRRLESRLELEARKVQARCYRLQESLALTLGH